MFDELNDLYQEVILDHSNRPRNYHPLPGANRLAQGRNPLCGDQIKVYLKMDGETITDVSFEGSGCAISKASSSLMTEVLKGHTREEALRLFERFHDLVTTGKGDDESLGKLAVFAGVFQYPARVKCAILAWHAVKSALEGREETVSTE